MYQIEHQKGNQQEQMNKFSKGHITRSPNTMFRKSPESTPEARRQFIQLFLHSLFA